MARVVGLDLSLTSTGVARVNGDTERWRPKARRASWRLVWLQDQLLQLLAEDDPELVVLEGYAYGAKGRAVFDIGEWGGVARTTIHRCGFPYAVIPPSVLKKFATGRGNADKDAVRVAAGQAARRDFRHHDESDAWWLWAIGRQLLGDPVIARRDQESVGKIDTIGGPP